MAARLSEDEMGSKPGWTPWTDEQVQRLRDLDAQGVMLKDIAADLGVTRKALKSKMERIGRDQFHTRDQDGRVKGWPTPERPRKPAPPPKPKRKPKATKQIETGAKPKQKRWQIPKASPHFAGVLAGTVVVKTASRPTAVEKRLVDAAPGRPVPYAELRSDQCAVIVSGDNEPVMCCGARRVHPRMQLCQAHVDLCLEKSPFRSKGQPQAAMEDAA